MLIERRMFIEGLPRIKNNKINWKASIGYKVKFQYEDIQGEIEIIDYDSKEEKLWIKYLDKEPFEIATQGFKNCMLGKLLGKKTNEFKIEIGQTFKDEKRDLTIIDRKYIKDKNGYDIKYYKYRCNKCGFECGEHYKNGEYKEEYWVEEYNLLKGIGCACCNGNQIVVPHINSIVAKEETHWMILYFQGDYDEAKLYTKSSSQKIHPICPDCGKIKDKLMSIHTLYNAHSIGCKQCGDGYSYPNKTMFNILEQLNIDFETEFSPKWCNFIFRNKIRTGKYDFYLKINKKEYIIEMDGGLGHGNGDNSLNGQTKEESIYIDNEKDRLAEEHGIEVIRINSKISNLEFIKNNENGILNSRLNELFDLSKIDWNKVEEFALSNLVKKACELKKDNPDMTTTDIGKIIGVQEQTIIKYLKKGTKLCWCYYNPKEEKRKSCSKPVEIFRNGVGLGVFKSCVELERQSEEKFGVKLYGSLISKVCLGQRPHHKGFTFKYI